MYNLREGTEILYHSAPCRYGLLRLNLVHFECLQIYQEGTGVQLYSMGNKNMKIGIFAVLLQSQSGQLDISIRQKNSNFGLYGAKKKYFLKMPYNWLWYTEFL